MNPPSLDRLVGILLFLPVPAVLVLFTRAPLGLVASFVLGVVLMGTHRLYARPWAVRRATGRCLWCAGPVHAPQAPHALDVAEPGGAAAGWCACSPAHADRALRLLAWAQRTRVLLVAGILGGLVVLLAGTVLAARGLLGPVAPRDAADTFRLMVAVAVLPLGWLGPSSAPPQGRVTVPFPVHIQALVGSLVVAWLFRLVGLWWLVDAGTALVHRLASR